MVLNCHGAASFGFQILILKQIPFDSSSTEQIPSCVNCRVRSTGLSRSSQSLLESLSRVLLWNQGSKCSCVRPFEPLGCVCWSTEAPPSFTFKILHLQFWKYTLSVSVIAVSLVERDIIISHIRESRTSCLLRLSPAQWVTEGPTAQETLQMDAHPWFQHSLGLWLPSLVDCTCD